MVTSWMNMLRWGAWGQAQARGLPCSMWKGSNEQWGYYEPSALWFAAP